MAFVRIEDKSGECELIVFPGVYEKLTSVWQQDSVVIAKGKVNYKDRDGNMGQELKVLVNTANVISQDSVTTYKATGKKPKPPKGSTPTRHNDESKPNLPSAIPEQIISSQDLPINEEVKTLSQSCMYN